MNLPPGSATAYARYLDSYESPEPRRPGPKRCPACGCFLPAIEAWQWDEEVDGYHRGRPVLAIIWWHECRRCGEYIKVVQ